MFRRWKNSSAETARKRVSMGNETREDLQYKSDKRPGVLGTITGECNDIHNPTRNGRKYSNELWEKVFSDPIVEEYFKNGGLPGQFGHPKEDQEIDPAKIAICMKNPPRKGSNGNYIGTWDILDTPEGRILNTLCQYGYHIGISSRGQGELITDYEGNEEVDPNQYQFSCFDAVLLPSVKTARLKYVSESLETKSEKTLQQALNESLQSSTEDERKIMLESLQELEIPYQLEANASIVNNKEVLDESVAVENNEATNVDDLQEAVKENRELNKQLLDLQEKLSVSYAKEAKLNEKVSQYKSTISKLSASSLQVKSLQEKLVAVEANLEGLNEKLKTSLVTSKKLMEDRNDARKKLQEAQASLKNQDKSLRSLNESLNDATSKSEKEVSTLNEQVATLKKDFSVKQNEYSKKLRSANLLVEKYKGIASSAVDKYIASKALQLGIKKQEIVNRLSESYTFSDIDEVCEELQSYSLNMSRLPFQSVKLNEGMKVKVTPSKPVIKNENDADGVDSQLLHLAGLTGNQ